MVFQELVNLGILGTTYELEDPEYIMHKARQQILACLKFYVSCLRIKFGEIKNLLDVLTQYEILGFCRLGLNRLGADY